jgi:hypothetical protein
MDLTYVERWSLGSLIKMAEEKVTAAIVDAEKCMCSYILMRNSNPYTAIAVTASRCVSVVEAAEKMPEFVGTVCNGLEVKNVLWINIRENSPKYQVIFLFDEVLRQFTLECPKIPIAEMINAGWVLWTPDARF